MLDQSIHKIAQRLRIAQGTAFYVKRNVQAYNGGGPDGLTALKAAVAERSAKARRGIETARIRKRDRRQAFKTWLYQIAPDAVEEF
jgi:hypothetical protein